MIAVALRQEAAYLPPDEVVLTGPGKVSTALAMARALHERRPSHVLNVGTAGALRPGMAGVHIIGRVLEHDFDIASIERLTGDSFPGEIELDPSSDVVLATGDVFVQDEALRAQLARRAHLVDMEGYAVARACREAGVPCTLVKLVSDEAGEGAATSWVEGIDAMARQIADVVAELRGRASG